MPSYNRAHVVADSIRGVLAQTFADFELLVHDDGSKDDSLRVIRAIEDPRIAVFAAENRGPPHPLVELLRRARGEYVIILHDHDLFDPTLLEKCVRALDEHPTAGFAMGGSAWVAEDGHSGYREMLHDWPRLNRGPELLRQLLERPLRLDSPFHACAMIRRSALEAVGAHYDVASGWYADVELTFRLLAQFDFVYLREVLFRFRERESGHVLDRRLWRTLEEMDYIHAGAIGRAFANDPEGRRRAAEGLARKIRHHRRKALLSCAAAGDRNQLTTGARTFAAPGSSWASRCVGRALLASGAAATVLIFAARVLRATKRRLAG
jgi:glycosyltransferase involved in cell wall biosynthesis